MWRLLYAMVAVSDAGSVAIDSSHTDWPTEQACHQAAHAMKAPPTATVGGVKLTIQSTAHCVPVDGLAPEMPPARYYGDPPPPPPPPPPPFVRGGFPGISFGPRGVRIGPIH